MIDFDPNALAKAQLKLDFARAGERLHLLERKHTRMRASPFAFLRGTAPFYYQLLAERRELRKGPAGRGWLVGDAHLENFGAYRPEGLLSETHGDGHADRDRRPDLDANSPSPDKSNDTSNDTSSGKSTDAPPNPSSDKSADKSAGKSNDKSPGKSFDKSADKHDGKKHKHEAKAVFDLNDFDEAVKGPLRYDVLRLVTSLVLALRDWGADATLVLTACESMIERYVAAAFDDLGLPAAPRPVEELLDNVRRRTRKDLLDARTERNGEGRRFVRGERYQDLPQKLVEAGKEAFGRYVDRLSPTERPRADQAEPMDLAFRIAGTGSLGVLRIAILVRGKGDPDGNWVFDMKEEDAPSAEVLVGEDELAPAERVSTGLRACLEHPPKMVGTTKLKGLSMLVRRLVPQEDKIDLTRLHREDLEPLAAYLGALLGKAHRRGATDLPDGRWSGTECEELLDKAITLAAIHEAVWLAYYRLSGIGKTYSTAK